MKKVGSNVVEFVFELHLRLEFTHGVLYGAGSAVIYLIRSLFFQKRFEEGAIEAVLYHGNFGLDFVVLVFQHHIEIV